MAIEVGEKKKEVKLPEGMDALFQFSVVLFVLVGLSYFFVWYLDVRAKETQEEIEMQIEQTKAQIPEKQALEEKARAHFNLIEDFKLVLDNHHISSPFFGFFEEIIHPNSMIFNVGYDFDENTGIVTGKGEDLVVVGQQFNALKDSQIVREVDLVELVVDDDEDTGERIFAFSFQIRIDRELFELKIKDD